MYTGMYIFLWLIHGTKLKGTALLLQIQYLFYQSELKNPENVSNLCSYFDFILLNNSYPQPHQTLQYINTDFIVSCPFSKLPEHIHPASWILQKFSAWNLWFMLTWLHLT